MLEVKFFSLFKNELIIHQSTNITEVFMKITPNGLNIMGIKKDIYDNRDAYLDKYGYLHVKGNIGNEKEDYKPIAPTSMYEPGSIDSSTGEIKESSSSVRTTDYKSLISGYKYTIYLSDIAKYFRFYFYDSSKNFISSTDEGTITGGSITVTPPTNAAYMKFKFGSEDQNQSTALAIAQNIEIVGKQIDGDGTTEPSEPKPTSMYEAGSLETSNGKEKDSATSIRTIDYISVSSNTSYIVTLPEKAKYFRFYFYDSNKNFIRCTDDGEVTTVVAETPTNAAYMKFKFSSLDENQSTALDYADNITIKKGSTNTTPTPTPDPGEIGGGDNELLYRFGVLADTHIDGDGNDEAHSHSDFKNAIAFFNDKGVAFTCIAGDVSRNGTTSDYKYVKKYFALANHPIYCVKGNHDNYESSSSGTSGYKSATGCENDFVKVMNGDVFIFLSMLDKDYKDGGLDSNKVAWLKNQFSTYKTKRKFLIYHMFIPGTCGNPNNLYWSPMSLSNSVCTDFAKAVKAQSNLIFIHGHSHFLFNLESKYSNANFYHKSGECYHIHTPSCARPRDASADTSYNKGEGYIVDVYTNKVVFRGFDVTTKSYKTSYVYTINLSQ